MEFCLSFVLVCVVICVRVGVMCCVGVRMVCGGCTGVGVVWRACLCDYGVCVRVCVLSTPRLVSSRSLLFLRLFCLLCVVTHTLEHRYIRTHNTYHTPPTTHMDMYTREDTHAVNTRTHARLNTHAHRWTYLNIHTHHFTNIP